MRRHDVITFDCYGTLIDWETGITDAFARAGAPLARAELLEAYGREEPRVQEVWRPYREVLAEVARRVAARFGVTLADEGRFLAESLPGWLPFADSNGALERLRSAGHELGILSNIDRDLIAATRRHFTVPFELVVTAEEVRSYKPGLAHFRRARELIGDRRWLHAGQSYMHDMVPARQLGIDHARVNRTAHMPFGGGQVDLEVRSMAELADALA